MRLIIAFLFLAIVLPAQNLVITNVSVIPIHTNTVLNNVNVYITGGVIDKIVAADVKLPFMNYKIVDGKGKFLIPGLADMHAHFPEKNSVFRMQEYLRLQIAAGVTTLRSMRGEDSHLKLRDSVQKGQKSAPDIFVSFVFPDASDSLMNKDKISEIVYAAKIKKFDFIKYLGGLKAKNMHLLSEACYEYKIPLAGHAYNNSLSQSVQRDFVSVEHFQPILSAFAGGTPSNEDLLKMIKDKKVALCPTLSFYNVISFRYTEQELANRNGMNVIRKETRDIWQEEYNESMEGVKKMLDTDFENKHINGYKKKFAEFDGILKMLADKDVLLLLSPDEGMYNVPGFAMAEEMKLYKNAGLSNYQILKCATINAAMVLKNDKTNGTIESGKKANLVLLNGNPIDNIDNIKMVEGTIINGKYFTQKEILGGGKK